MDALYARGLAGLVWTGAVWFDVGAIAVLRAAIWAMRILGWLLNVPSDRAERDIMVLEWVGQACILAISIHTFATISCAMGQLLHGFGAWITFWGRHIVMGRRMCRE